MKLRLYIGRDLLQIVAQRLGFAETDLIGFLLLAVEIGNVHPIKIDQNQLADAGPGQRNRDIGTETAETADGNGGGGKFLLQFLPLA